MSPRIKRNSTKAEAKRQLIETLRDLSRDAQAYDEGNFNAVNRSSVSLRSIFYQSNHSTGLVQNLKIEKELYLYSFASRFDEKTDVDFGQLYSARFLNFNYLTDRNELQDYLIFNPTNDSKPHRLRLEDWWDEPLIWIGKTILTRSQLILAAANQDGGAHFDNQISKKFGPYYSFKTGQSGFVPTEPTNPSLMKFLFGNMYDTPKPKNVHFRGITLGLLRQVIHETELSFSKWQKLPTDYQPNFDYNWKRKTNYLGWHIKVMKKE